MQLVSEAGLLMRAPRPPMRESHWLSLGRQPSWTWQRASLLRSDSRHRSLDRSEDGTANEVRQP